MHLLTPYYHTCLGLRAASNEGAPSLGLVYCSHSAAGVCGAHRWLGWRLRKK